MQKKFLCFQAVFRISSFAFLYGLIRSSFWMASSLRDQQNTFCFISHKSDLAFDKTAIVEVQATDRYGRTVGRVYIDRIDINAETVRRSAAWAYRKYAKDLDLFDMKCDAKLNKRGLWNLPESERVPTLGVAEE